MTTKEFSKVDPQSRKKLKKLVTSLFNQDLIGIRAIDVVGSSRNMLMVDISFTVNMPEQLQTELLHTLSQNVG